MPAPLYDALVHHRNLGRASFHTPGHKNNPEALPQDLYSLDFTELPDTDSLFDASGPIMQAEKLASEFFGTARTCFSAGGCTLCIQAMFRLALPEGGKVLCSRVIHRSAVNAMALFGSTSPSYPVMASLDCARAWLQANPNAFLPLQEKVAEIKKLAQRRGIALPAGKGDPARITLNTASIGLHGTEAAELFRKAGVEPEYADADYVVLIATPFNTEKDFMRLKSAIENLPCGRPLPAHPSLPALPPVKEGLREAVLEIGRAHV